MRADTHTVFTLVWRFLSREFQDKIDDEVEKEGLPEVTWDVLVRYMRKKAMRSAHHACGHDVNEHPSGPPIESAGATTKGVTTAPAAPSKPAAKIPPSATTPSTSMSSTSTTVPTRI